MGMLETMSMLGTKEINIIYFQKQDCVFHFVFIYLSAVPLSHRLYYEVFYICVIYSMFSFVLVSWNCLFAQSFRKEFIFTFNPRGRSEANLCHSWRSLSSENEYWLNIQQITLSLSLDNLNNGGKNENSSPYIQWVDYFINHIWNKGRLTFLISLSIINMLKSFY